MDKDTLSRVVELLDRRTSLIAAMSGSPLARCGACGLLVPERLIEEHRRAYGDRAHEVAEVMET